MSEYEPGTVAEIGWRMTSGKERALRIPYGWQTESGVLVAEPTDIRPLVVLDLDTITTPEENCGIPASTEVVKCLNRAGESAGGWRGTVAMRIADQIEAQVKPPRIPEPGLWGVVREGVDGDTYVRESFGTVRQWSRLGGQGLFVTWDEINNPTLIREGVTA